MDLSIFSDIFTKIDSLLNKEWQTLSNSILSDMVTRYWINKSSEIKSLISNNKVKIDDAISLQNELLGGTFIGSNEWLGDLTKISEKAYLYDGNKI